MSYSCTTCTLAFLPDLVELAKGHSAVQWWAPPDLAVIQAEIVHSSRKHGRCDRHAILIGDLVAMTIRQEAIMRAALPTIPAPPRGG